MDAAISAAIAWVQAPEYWLSRWLLERWLAAIYLIGFVVVVHQWSALLGDRGLLPTPAFIKAVPFRLSPSLFYWRYSDRLALALGWAGVALAALVFLGVPQAGAAWLPALAWLCLWLLYLSFVNVGQ